MKLGTKALILGSAACMALGALTSCDRGVAPVCTDGDTTCVAMGDVSTTSTGKGGTGITTPGGTKTDSTATGITGSTGSTGSTWNPAYDTGANIKSVAKTDFVGAPSVLGGDARRLAFYVVDSSLHIVASSDGTTQTFPNRETFYDLQILSTDSIQFGWDSKTDKGLAAKASLQIDPITSLDPHPLYLTVLQMPVIANALEAHLTARRGSTFMVWVKARSGSTISGNAVSIPEDSLPRLGIAATRALLFSGASLKPIPTDPFQILVP
jgi:hypothetical protein